MLKIVLDIFGGDYAPEEAVKGAIMAINKCNELFVVLAGDKAKIENELSKYKYNKEQIEILHAPDVILNTDTPTIAIKKKVESSLVKSFELIKSDDEVKGIVSAGSTGAILTGAVTKLGRIKGIKRPGLMPILPTLKGSMVAVLDVGANMDSKPEYLHQFALMGQIYMSSIFNVAKPKVALLNVGTEEGKGNELTKEVYDLLLKDENINFVGNIEARDALSGDYDLVVTDGFAGNIFLKSTEGAVNLILGSLKSEIKSSFKSKIGYLFMKKSFRNLKTKLDYNSLGGAVFIGCKKQVIKVHGSSKSTAFCSALLQSFEMAKHDVLQKIENEISVLTNEDN